MKLTLYPHGGSGNHGCEAIVRSTRKLTQAELNLYSNNCSEDTRYGLLEICNVREAQQTINRKSIGYLQAFLQNKLQGNTSAFDELVFRHIVRDAETADAFLSIGGDNYCYGMPEYILLVNRMLDRKKIKRILWGASVEPSAIDQRMLEDLTGYHRIWSRESLTHEAMLAKGLSQSILMPDPAFVLDRKDLPLPNGFVEGYTVGINASPMIIGYEKNQGSTLENYIELINYIIKHTDMQVALIPHVVWSYNDDRKPLTLLYDRFKDTGRVIMVDAEARLNAEELKGVIARCRFLVAARTHASIAAYSQQVPTLVVGYSVKARGIARDIFGTEENYVLPVQTMRKPNDLSDAFCWLTNNERQIHRHLQSFMPDYIGRIDVQKVLR